MPPDQLQESDSGRCSVCGTEITGVIGSWEGWTRNGCPLGPMNDDETEWPCHVQEAAIEEDRP